MPVPREILSELRTFLDVEIQAGRRHAPLDPGAVSAFLSAARPSAPAAAAPAPVAASVSATVHVPAPAPRAAASAAPAVVIAAPPAADTPAARAAAAGDLEAVAEAVRACRACALAATRTRSVPGEGAPQGPDVMFVGEAPGRDEDVQGRPFVGAAGKLLDKMIAAMGYAREQVFIANVLKCRPPQNRTPTPEEMALCLPYLRRQIALVRPRTIVALGATAYRGLTGDQAAIASRVRGIWTEFDGIPMMPTFHPAYLLRVPSAKRVVWEDLQKVLARLKEIR